MLHRLQCDLIQDCAQVINVLLDELQDEDELFASAATLRSVEAHLLVIGQTLAHLSPELSARLNRIDWHGWQCLCELLAQDRQPRREEVWYAVRALMPAALEFITQLRRQEPLWFEFGY